MNIFIFVDNNLVVKNYNNAIMLPNYSDIKALNLVGNVIQQDAKNYVIDLNEENSDFSKYHLQPIHIRQAFAFFEPAISNKIIYYLQLAHYYSTHKFCGICGGKLIRLKLNRFMYCSPCQRELYPKLAPCIIVRITRNDEILLARSPHFPEHVWALIAGFVDLGENLEEALRREVREEVGIEVDNIRYWGSQSWPIPTSSLMIGFTAEYKSGEITVDNQEIIAAGFFSKDNMPGKPPTHFSIASEMIEAFLK